MDKVEQQNLNNLSDDLHMHAKVLQSKLKLLHCAKNLKRFKKVFLDLHRSSSMGILRINRADPRHMDKLGDMYDQLMVMMRKPVVIKIFNALAKIFSLPPTDNPYVLNGKHILSMFAFGGYPEFSLEFYRGTEDLSTVQGQLYTTARKVLQLWMRVIFNKRPLVDCRQFLRYLNRYSYYYAIHMNKDRVHKLNQLFMKWYHEENEKDDAVNNEALKLSDREYILRRINERQRSTLSSIRRFYREFDVSVLDKFRDLIDKRRDIVHKAFWDKIGDDILKGDNSSFFNILSELRSELLNSIPESDFKKELVKEMDEHFDMDFIGQKLKYNILDEEHFDYLCEHILDIFQRLHSPARVPIMKKKWNDMKSVSDGKKKEDRYKDSLRFLFCELDVLRDSIVTMSILNELGINVFTL